MGEKEERREEEKHEEEIEVAGTAMLAVGIVVLIAGARGSLACLLQEWRALIFLLLNLVVLTILFTSVRSNSNQHQPNNNSGEAEMNKKRKKTKKKTERKKRSRWSVGVDEVLHCDGESVLDDCDDGLSKDELNARVEAFIVMFRRQLALDAQGRSCF